MLSSEFALWTFFSLGSFRFDGGDEVRRLTGGAFGRLLVLLFLSSTALSSSAEDILGGAAVRQVA
jgi:hypothetical protein